MDITPINLYRLQIFMAVARHQSFTQAAEEMHTSQPNISKQVQLLESELSARLFDRSGGGVAMTDAGRIVLDFAEGIFGTIGELRRALNELEGLDRGYLRLGASSTPGVYLVPPILARFRGQYPDLEVTFHLGNSQEIVQKILNDQLDLGLVGGYETMPGIQAQPFTREELIVIAPVEHPLVENQNITATDLEKETFIWREGGSGTREGMRRLLHEANISPVGSLEIFGSEGVKRAVAAGLGLSVVSRHAVEMELSQGVLVILCRERLSLERLLFIVNRKDRRLSAAALAFLSNLRKHVSGA